MTSGESRLPIIGRLAIAAGLTVVAFAFPAAELLLVVVFVALTGVDLKRDRSLVDERSPVE